MTHAYRIQHKTVFMKTIRDGIYMTLGVRHVPANAKTIPKICTFVIGCIDEYDLYYQ